MHMPSYGKHITQFLEYSSNWNKSQILQVTTFDIVTASKQILQCVEMKELVGVYLPIQ